MEFENQNRGDKAKPSEQKEPRLNLIDVSMYTEANTEVMSQWVVKPLDAGQVRNAAAVLSQGLRDIMDSPFGWEQNVKSCNKLLLAVAQNEKAGVGGDIHLGACNSETKSFSSVEIHQDIDSASIRISQPGDTLRKYAEEELSGTAMSDQDKQKYIDRRARYLGELNHEDPAKELKRGGVILIPNG